MRKIYFIWMLLGVLVMGQAHAQKPNGLYVHSVKGKVLYRAQTGGAWSVPTAKMPVSRLDSLSLSEGAEVVLIDGSNDNVYTCKEAKKDNILHWIQAARKNANSLLTSVARQLADNALGRGVKAESTVITGVTTRAEEEDKVHDSIACLAWLEGQRMLAGEKIEAPLSLKQVEENGLVHFVITNESDKAYCVNVLTANKLTKAISLRVAPSPDVEASALVVPAGETMDLSMFRYLPNSALEYAVFATETGYVPSAVKSLLNYPEDLKCK